MKRLNSNQKLFSVFLTYFTPEKMEKFDCFYYSDLEKMENESENRSPIRRIAEKFDPKRGLKWVNPMSG